MKETGHYTVEICVLGVRKNITVWGLAVNFFK